MKGNCGSTKARAASIEGNWAKPKPLDWPVKTMEGSDKGKREKGIVNRIVQEKCKWTGKCLLISLG
jgi:hypothetical protein